MSGARLTRSVMTSRLVFTNAIAGPGFRLSPPCSAIRFGLVFPRGCLLNRIVNDGRYHTLMAFRSLSSLVPHASDLLALEVEELAGVLLANLNSYEGMAGNSVYQNGLICQSNFVSALEQTGRGQKPEYGGKQPLVSRALMEAWAWLEREGILIRDPNQPAPWFFISRRGQGMRSQQDFEAYRKASLLPKSQLHPLIATKVYPAFLRGEYDTAIFQAFREVEVAVRAAAGFPADLVGVNLMREALRPVKNTAPAGPLTDTLLPVAEQEGMASLFAGAILLYKNPQSHRNVPADAADAAEVIGFASHLLRMVDRRKAESSAKQSAAP